MVAAVLAALPFLPWYSNFDVDSLTWFEQVRSVAETGSIGFFNGEDPVTNTESSTLWFVARGGRIWGIYPAPLTYLLAPFCKLAGFRGIIAALWLSELAAALSVYATLSRVTRDRRLAVGAAWALMLSTSWLFWSTTVCPFVPAGALLGWAVEARVRGQREGLSGAAALGAAGLLAGLAFGAHLVTVGALGLLGLSTLWAPGWAARARGAGAFLLGAMPSVLLMAWVNHQRFGTWSPLSYGPCGAQNCLGASGQDFDHYAAIARQLATVLAPLGVCLWVGRRSARGVGLIALGAALFYTLRVVPPERSLVLTIRSLYGYLIDLGGIEIANFHHTEDGLSNLHNGWAVRAFLQCVPVMVLGVHAGGEGAETPARRTARWAASLVVCGVLTMGVLRAHEWSSAVWGNPFLNVRYLVVVMPAAAVLAALALEGYRFGAGHLAVWAVAALAGARWLAADPLALTATQRWATHLLPLGLAGALLALRSERQGWRTRALTVTVMLSLGYQSALVLGVDAMAVARLRSEQDARTRELARVPESRFMLLGGYALDQALALHDRREIRFVNLGLDRAGQPGAEARVRRWLAEGGAVYIIEDNPGGPWNPRWPGLRLSLVPGTTRIVKVSREG